MSYDIASVGRMPETGPVPANTHVNAAPKASHVSDSVKVDTIPSTPPPEVYEAMGQAAQSYDKLAATGRELRFRVEPASGRLVVEVHDRHGNLLFAVPPSKALDVAGGGSLD
jgi:hypothetical protein